MEILLLRYNLLLSSVFLFLKHFSLIKFYFFQASFLVKPLKRKKIITTFGQSYPTLSCFLPLCSAGFLGAMVVVSYACHHWVCPDHLPCSPVQVKLLYILFQHSY